MSSKKYFTIGLALMTALLMCSCGSEESGEQSSKAAAPVGDSVAQTEQPAAQEVQEDEQLYRSLKSFTATTLEGAEIDESELARADVTVINIWSTTCGPCLDEMDELSDFERSLPDNVKLMTWCLDGFYNTDYAKDIIYDAEFDGITLIDGTGDLASLGGRIMYTPTTVFVDHEGNITTEPIIGAGNISEGYTEKINELLTAQGKDTI